jgi:hypothetical protein
LATARSTGRAYFSHSVFLITGRKLRRTGVSSSTWSKDPKAARRQICRCRSVRRKQFPNSAMTRQVVPLARELRICRGAILPRETKKNWYVDQVTTVRTPITFLLLPCTGRAPIFLDGAVS